MRRSLIASCCLFALVAGVTEARPPHKQSLRWYYGDLLPPATQACTTCHLTREQVEDPSSFDDAAPPHNAFGERLSDVVYEQSGHRDSLDIPEGLRTIAAEDADGDGVTNEVEIVTGHSPGLAADKPTAEEVAAAGPPLQRFHERQARYRWRPFEPVVRPAVPAMVDPAASNPIDRFVAAELVARGLQPRPAAAPAVLLRRVFLDLIGLPPTPEQLREFLADPSPTAYERVVDRLLAHPGYGERWGRHWMDIWRYSDWAGWTGGKQIRDSQPHIWRWRDWIVESLNEDKPYDRMVTEMLSADEQWPTDANTLRATGFLVRNYKMLSRETWMQDTVNHTMLAFLGLTVGCARCHDHMYDAISQSEYYRLRAIFDPYKVRLDPLPGEPDTTKDGLARAYDADLQAVTYLYRKGDDRDPDKDHPLAPGALRLLGELNYDVAPISLPPAAWYPASQPHVQQQLTAAAEAEVARAEKSWKDSNAAVTAAAKAAADPLDVATADLAKAKAGLAERILAASRARLASVKARIAADNAKYAAPPAAIPETVAQALAAAAAKAEREANHAQAIVDAMKAELKRFAVLTAIQPGDDKSQAALTETDKALAEAIKNRDAADRARQDNTVEYSPLGPVYPAQSSGRRTALARWITDRRNPLAARVAANHIWLRHFGQPLLPTVFDFGRNGQQPTHPALLDWLAAELMEPEFATSVDVRHWSMKHLHRLIVTSRTYRQASTADAHNLAIDPDNRWYWRKSSHRMEAELVRDGILYVAGQLDLTRGGPDIDHQNGLSVPRRSIYFQHAQEKQMEFLKMFDAAAVTECYQRKESIVPQQALALANSALTREQARVIARKLNGAVGPDDQQFVAAAFEQVLSRPATSDELQVSVEFLAEQRQTLAASSDQVAAAGGPVTDPDPKRPSADPALRARESLVHVLLNHNDFLSIR